MDDLNKRIIEIMIKMGHSKSSFARELDVSLPLITHITTGRNKPGLELIQKLLLRFPELSPEWILVGNGDMFREQAKAIDLTAEMARYNALSNRFTAIYDQIEATKAYHRILTDELLHLQEIDLHLSHSASELQQIQREISGINEQIKVKLEN